MTTAAGNPLLHVNILVEPGSRHSLERRMANRAARALRRIADFQNLGDAGRPGGGQRRVRTGMKIELRPDDVLMSVVARSAVATGGTAGLRAEEFGVRGFELFFLSVNLKQDAKRSNDTKEVFRGR